MAVFCISAFAEPVSESEARKTALSLLKSELSSNRLKSGNKLKSENLTLIKVKKDGNTPLYYVYNAEDDGFVIVSGVEETEPILAYGLEKGIDMDNMSDATKALLRSYAAALKKIAANPSSYQMSIKAETKDAISPLITTKWDQEGPYWNLLNFQLEERTDSFVQCVTGCTATATSMLMKYYHDKYGWFAGTKEEIPGYKIRYPIGDNVIDSMIVETLPAIEKFDWDNCNDKYSPNGNDEKSDLAVATVMRYCGQAQNMNYGEEGSGSNEYNVVINVNKYLVGDDPFQAVLFSKKEYADEDWYNILYTVLKNGHPVNILGYGNETLAHSFIFDGYESRDNGDYYHVNWGWSGMADGYYRYDSLFAKAIAGASDVMDLNSLNSAITFLTDDELKEYEDSYGVADFFSGSFSTLDADNSNLDSYKYPLTYIEDGEEVNNNITIQAAYAPLKERKILEPYLVVYNISDEESEDLYFAADKDTVYDPNIMNTLTFKLNLKELKDSMIAKGLPTDKDDVYKIMLKLSGDKDVQDDYLTKYFQYFFKFCDDDTLQIIPQIIVDTLILGNHGINGMKAHFTVPEDLRGQKYYVSGAFRASTPTNPFISLEMDEIFIDEDTEEGYFRAKYILDGSAMSIPGSSNIVIRLGNGLIAYSDSLVSMGYTTNATQAMSMLTDNESVYYNICKTTTFGKDQYFYTIDSIVGTPVYNEDEGTWGYGVSPMYGKVVMDANNDNGKIFQYPFELLVPLKETSDFLDKNKDEILSLYDNDYKTLYEKYTVSEKYGASIPTKVVLEDIEKYEAQEDSSFIYRLVTTVDSALFHMPQDGLYYASFFRAKNDYSELEFISPVEIPGDNANITIQDTVKLAVTLKPVEGILDPRVAANLTIYSDKDYENEIWKGTTTLKITRETDVNFTNTTKSPHGLVEGQTYYYVLVNHDGILISRGSFNATTAINEVNAVSDNNSTSAKYNGKKYNLAGQEVDDNYKGIVILNGAKHVQN